MNILTPFVLLTAGLLGSVGVQAPADPGPRLCLPSTTGTRSSTTPSSTKVNGVPARISQLEWLGGSWIGSAGQTVFEERWTPPAGGSMLAVSRTLRNGVMNAFEFICIVERDGGLVYTAMPNGRQPATDFTLTKVEARSVTFENPAHDFPKMIQYTLKPDGALEAIVSGDPAQKPQVFTFRRQ